MHAGVYEEIKLESRANDLNPTLLHTSLDLLSSPSLLRNLAGNTCYQPIITE